MAVFENLNEKPAIVDCYRFGKESENAVAPRPIKVTLSSSDIVRQILSKTGLLKEVSGYECIYLSPDRSPSERAAHKKLVEQLKLKRSDDSDKVHFIRNNKIVSRDKKVEEI